MPRYYFHVCDGAGFVEDEEGCDLPDEEAARQRAIVSARDIMSSDVRKGELDLSSFLEVEDEQKQLAFNLSFAEALAIRTFHKPMKTAIEWRRRGCDDPS